ncbi:hypothetical protein LEP1GSC193_0448 [Leptospira alstonii serovar Pingchang str. 80-412]|uniref:Uncharacterized protein n=2 Tax=Leptospira alstonii TaxID=28452 RepID=M6D5W1_9LEPT|nr:hypothetical protein LEP1GSC194_1479 [Leptospira alstonii serovar Sichuan str. 79601]EQA79581.1 hypothetical protein LEP1GSC193_0448 [Leptospira alstonii serovar Pingchang str. 80-412]
MVLNGLSGGEKVWANPTPVFSYGKNWGWTALELNVAACGRNI